MDMIAKIAQAATVSADVLVVWLDEKGNFGQALQALDKASDGYFSARQQAGDLPEAGKWVLFHAVQGISAERVLVLGVNQESASLRKMASAVWAKIAEQRWEKCVFALHDIQIEHSSRIFVSALYYSAYRFEGFKAQSETEKKTEKWRKKWQGEWLIAQKDALVEEDLAWANALNVGSTLARDLGNTPPNVCTPTWLGNQAEKLAKHYDSISVEVLKEKEIKALKMGALLCVAQGSQEEARFITMEYKAPKAVNKKPIG